MGDFRLRMAAGGRAAGALRAGRRWLGGIAAIMVGTLMVGGVPAASALAARAGGHAMTAWTIVPSANPRAPLGELAAVSCAGRAACTAVGSRGASGPPLAETWNGRRWAIHPVPGMAREGTLIGVSCWRPTACVAIGGTALAFRWDGRRWHTMAPARGAGSSGAALDGVSCRSARFCVATGTHTASNGSGGALAEVWNGVRWSVRSVPLPARTRFSELTAVSCATRTACTAVGYYARSGRDRALAERWNGVRWARSQILTPAGARFISMTGVSCPAVNACQAVGSSEGPAGQLPLAESWNGTRWAAETTPAAATLSSVSCASRSACLAVGSQTGPTGHDIVFAQAWNGRAWTRLHTPVSKADAVFLGVSCSAAAACTAVGDHLTQYGQPVLAQRWNGATWVSQPAPTPVRVFGGDLAGISCTSATWCASVGDVGNPGGVEQPLAEAWNGRTWSVVPTPHLAVESGGFLSRVACVSPRSCMAVGGASRVGPLAERWDGHTWALTKVASPAPSQIPVLTGVTCVAGGSCLAVGVSDGATLAERWNGTAWTVQATPNPPGAKYSALSAASCTSPTACTAVGYSSSGAGFATLAERWDGTAWTVLPTPSPGLGPQFTAVSCSSATVCTAIGTTQDGSFAENWNGTAWTPVTVPSPPSGQAVLTGVACTAASACEAVGGVMDDSGHNDAMLAERWDGATWRMESTQFPHGAEGPELSDVSCLRGAGCLAVGTRSAGFFNGGTLVERRG